MAINRSRLLTLRVQNVGCIGSEPVEIALDQVVCLVGRNNAGKSTILRSYELAKGSASFDPTIDRCRWAPDSELSAIELEAHIPAGIANVDAKWKQARGGDLVVRSRWEWDPATNYQKVRKTWDPAAEGWAEDGKAGGADNVFNSRLPQPLRIGSLEDATATESVLLTLALEPFVTQMTEHEGDPNSGLSRSVRSLVDHVQEMAADHQAQFQTIATSVERGFAGVFPKVGVRLKVGMMPPPIKLKDLLKAGSGIRVREGDVETSLAQQGTGARRALFWSMLQVHNELKRKADIRAERKKPILSKLKKESDPDKRAELEAAVAAIDASDHLPEDADDPAFPGYLLLIDEPENALHPMAARMAQRHLYDLGKDANWQVIMTTHSPFFVNPLEDHTTIVRLEREGGEDGPLRHKTYRAEDVKFDENERLQLQALQQMDTGFSEVFFGSYPILVEGDTEHAAFLAAVVEANDELSNEVTIIRARGKAILPALIRMLRHFKVNFGILHDVDWPMTATGAKRSPMWSVNRSIFDELAAARADGISVRHRCSVPDFERAIGGVEIGSEKPLEAYLRLSRDEEARKTVRETFSDLFSSGDHHPDGCGLRDTDGYEAYLRERLTIWAEANGHGQDPRLVGPREN